MEAKSKARDFSGFILESKMRKLTKKILFWSIPLAILIIVFIVYVNDFYRADMKSINGYIGTSNNMSHTEDMIVFSPDDSSTGLIFYPGGKVEFEAYIPLMQALADRGITTVLLKMPFNLAILDINKANGIADLFPHINNWYLGGHSLGGSAAAMHLASEKAPYEGLILLASYSTKPLASKSIEVLSIYGSEDGVLDLNQYEENKQNLPKEFREIIIEGGNHAGFGMYGIQQGDGVASISNIDQIELTAEAIESFIFDVN